MDSRMQRTVAALAVVASMALPGVAMAQNVKTGGSETLTIKGFIIASLYANDQNFVFGNGQNSEFAAADYGTDKWTLGGDVRNTRMTFVFNGPEVSDMKVGAVLEADFFGGTFSGGFQDEQPIPRLRLAYVDVIRGNTTFRVGQAWTPLFGNVPASPTHVAFPLGYGSAGMIGWRQPGLFVYHTFSKQAKLTLAAFRGSWSEASGPYGVNAGTSGTPQFEARLDFSSGPASFYVVGHYDQKDCNGPGSTTGSALCAGTTKKTLDGTALEVGGKVSSGPFALQGNLYTGKAIGQQFGEITQFGDISGWGGWLQASLKFNPNWSGHLFYGMDDPKNWDVLNSGGNRIKNEQLAVSTMYSNGPYVFGVEYLHNKLTKGLDNEGTITQSTVSGNQLSFSVWYKF